MNDLLMFLITVIAYVNSCIQLFFFSLIRAVYVSPNTDEHEYNIQKLLVYGGDRFSICIF